MEVEPMPVKIATFACKFRCRYVNTKKRTVVEHERRCTSNPDRRGCKTCKHFDNGYDPAYPMDDPSPFCDEDNLKPWTKTNPSGMRFNCPRWEAQ
jgi:hypothetical protein